VGKTTPHESKYRGPFVSEIKGVTKRGGIVLVRMHRGEGQQSGMNLVQTVGQKKGVLKVRLYSDTMSLVTSNTTKYTCRSSKNGT